MTPHKRDKAEFELSLKLYGAFKASQSNNSINHKIILACQKVYLSLRTYRGHTRGVNKLPDAILEAKYEEYQNDIDYFRSKIDTEARAYREARQAVDDLEELLNDIFI